MRSMVTLSESTDRKHESTISDEMDSCELDMVGRVRLTEPIWHLRQTNRAAAVHLLLNKPSGAFVVRDITDNGVVRMVLSVVDHSRTKIRVKHFPIQKSSCRISALHLASSERNFSDLPALIAFYCSIGEGEFPILVLPREIEDARTRSELLSIVANDSQVRISLMFDNCCIVGSESNSSSLMSRHETAIEMGAVSDVDLNLVNDSASIAGKTLTIEKALSASFNSVVDATEDSVSHLGIQLTPSGVNSCQSSTLSSRNSSNFNGVVYYKSSLRDKLSDYEDIWTDDSHDTCVPLTSSTLSHFRFDKSSKTSERLCEDFGFYDYSFDSEAQLGITSAGNQLGITSAGNQLRITSAGNQLGITSAGNKEMRKISCRDVDNVQLCGLNPTKYRLKTPTNEKNFNSSSTFPMRSAAAVRPFVISQTLTHCSSQPRTQVNEIQTTISANIIVSRQCNRTTPREIVRLPNGNVIHSKEESNKRMTGIFQFDFYETQQYSSRVTNYVDCLTDSCPLCYPSPGYALPYDALMHDAKTTAARSNGFSDHLQTNEKSVGSLNYVSKCRRPYVENGDHQRTGTTDDGHRRPVNPALSNACRIKPKKSQNSCKSFKNSNAVIPKASIECNGRNDRHENIQCFTDARSLIKEDRCDGNQLGLDDPTIIEDYQLPVDALQSETNIKTRNTLPRSVKVLRSTPLLGTMGRNIASCQPFGFLGLECKNEDRITGKRRSLRTSFSTVRKKMVRNCDREFENLEPRPVIANQETSSSRNAVASVHSVLNDQTGVEMNQLCTDLFGDSETVDWIHSNSDSLSSGHRLLPQREISHYDNVDFSSTPDIPSSFNRSSSSKNDHHHDDDDDLAYHNNTLALYCPTMSSSRRTVLSTCSSTQYCQPWDTFRISQIFPEQRVFPLSQDQNEVCMGRLPVASGGRFADEPIASNYSLSTRQRVDSLSDFSVEEPHVENSRRFGNELGGFAGKCESFHLRRSPSVIVRNLTVSEKTVEANSMHIGQEMMANRVVEFMINLSLNKEIFFGMMIQNFIECTKRGKEKDPKNVTRNVRQFMNGMKNYIIHRGEENLSDFIKTETSKMKSFEFLSFDNILEQALHRCVVDPLYDHMCQLHMSKCGGDHGLPLTTDRIKFVHSIVIAKIGITYTQSLEAAIADGVRLISTMMERSYSPAMKFNCIQSAIHLIYDQIGKSENLNGRRNFADTEGVCWAVVEVLVRSKVVALQFEFEFIQALMDSSVLTGEGRFHLCIFNCAIQLIKRLTEKESNGLYKVTTQSHAQAILDEMLLAISVPDEKCGNLRCVRIPFQPNSVVSDLCSILAYKLRVECSHYHGLFLVSDGNETRLPDNFKAVDLVALQDSIEHRIVYKRINAVFIWPAKSLVKT